ncbi:hypothetical protein Cob_v007327 [Colletotrichum orbiculare MAFF 240422]|uniref:Uncharacterized protein n=1 Tax=Colletotrichum orbiculare (strain 104-T / ATCC 96160 / CBS 514.97 / LARS 414 / MAFF 240422) TaxID=1213857 RepID=A0A484FN55_COLOR|nr:hypothetical protein Cob_v007327 [Colletotrichum orbiculare MAFF 240422]
MEFQASWHAKSTGPMIGAAESTGGADSTAGAPTCRRISLMAICCCKRPHIVESPVPRVVLYIDRPPTPPLTNREKPRKKFTSA